MATVNQSPRLFIGTLYSNENEFAACVQSIRSQTYQNYDHFVFANLPNKEAHVALFSAFLEKKAQYDLLIKVDADMVINDPALFEKIVLTMQTHPGKHILSIAVYDFFSDQLIYGLNAYRNTVQWDFSKENLFVDIPLTPREFYIFDDYELAPAAIHGGNPSPFHAFHYGVHRGMKVVQPAQDNIRESSRRAKWTNMERTWQHYLRTKDSRLGLASLGAELAYGGAFHLNDLDMTDTKVARVLEKFENLDPPTLRRTVSLLRFLNFGFLPNNRRREIICRRVDRGLNNKFILRIISK